MANIWRQEVRWRLEGPADSALRAEDIEGVLRDELDGWEVEVVQCAAESSYERAWLVFLRRERGRKGIADERERCLGALKRMAVRRRALPETAAEILGPRKDPEQRKSVRAFLGEPRLEAAEV